jgi:hypothetical protein
MRNGKQYNNVQNKTWCLSGQAHVDAWLRELLETSSHSSILPAPLGRPCLERPYVVAMA